MTFVEADVSTIHLADHPSDHASKASIKTVTADFPAGVEPDQTPRHAPQEIGYEFNLSSAAMKSTKALTLGIGCRLEGQTTRNFPVLFMKGVKADTSAPDANCSLTVKIGTQASPCPRSAK